MEVPAGKSMEVPGRKEHGSSQERAWKFQEGKSMEVPRKEHGSSQERAWKFLQENILKKIIKIRKELSERSY